MATSVSLISELEDAIARGSSEKRIETLRRVTDLFLLNSDSFSEPQVGLFDDVIGKLAAEIETKARVELSNRLAPVANAPVNVVRDLAHDDEIDVAAPVLTQSPRLTETDIVGIAKEKSQDHLLAISARPQIGETITDVLVARGNQRVVRAVARNEKAKFSEFGFTTLVKRSEGDDVLAERVGLRADIPQHHFKTLLGKATEQVREKLAAAAPAATRDVARVVSGIAEKIGSEAGVAPGYDFATAQRLIAHIQRNGKLTEQHVADFARDRKVAETIAALSALCQIPIEVVERLTLGERPDPILILTKAAGFSWSSVRAIIQARPVPMGTSGLDEASENFDRLSTVTAQRVMRFWQVRQAAVR
jgi:uncharacterized protein (DUF2336 family)